MKHFIQTLFYWATTYWPRLLPRDENEWVDFQLTLRDFYGVPDTAQTWATVAGHVTSTPAHKVRRPYGYFANVAKRFSIINPAAQRVRMTIIEGLKQQLARAVAAETDKNKEGATGGPNTQNADGDETFPQSAEAH